MNNEFFSGMEQFEAHLVTVAKLISSYHEELIRSGIPSEIARELTVDFHNFYWTMIMNKSNN